MPELPEVETVVRTLERQIQGSEIKDIHILYPKVIANVSSEEFHNRLLNQHFREFHRRGKYLIFEMEDAVLITHLRMEGKFYLQPKGAPYDKHTHVIFTLNDNRDLQYHDVRKFGRFYLYQIGEELTCLNELGLEPWDENLNAEYLREKLSHNSAPIKSALLDQSIIAGIGNIYANEICFACHLYPAKAARELRESDYENIIRETRRILAEAIQAGGSTIRDYTSSLGVTGRFQQSLKVHMQKMCPQCGNEIKKIKVNGRGTYYCSNCQK